MKKQLLRVLTLSAVLTGMTLSAATPKPAPPTNPERPATDFSAPDRANVILKGRTRGTLPSSPMKFSLREAAATQAADDAPLLYTAMFHADSWGTGAKYGIYSFSPAEYGFTEVTVDNQTFNCNGGAGFIGQNTFWTMSYEDFGDMIWAEANMVSTETWSSVFSTYFYDTKLVATDFAYNSLTERIYGCFSNEEQTGYEFGEFDYEQSERNKICTLDKPWIACAFDSQGQLYAIDNDGMLNRVNLTTGGLTPIASTGLTSQNLTSGTIDTATDIFYVATSNPGNSALYSVDLTSGIATKLYDMADNEELVGMYVGRSGQKQLAPGTPTDLSIDFAPGSLTGKISFVMPSTDSEGGTLSGTLDYEIALADKTIATGQALAGARVEKEITVDAYGSYRIIVTAKANGVAGKPAVTNLEISESGLQGDVALPYYQDFASAEGFKDFQSLDGNNDGVTWYHWAPYQNVYSGVNPSGPADDYLVAPGVYMIPGKMYRFSADIIQRGASDAEDFEILIGTAPEINALKTSVYDHTVLTDGKTHRPIADVMVDRAGVYYFAIHIFSPRGRYGVYVDNVAIEDGVNLTAPGACEIAVTNDPQGLTKATIEITAPTVNVEGNALTEISKIEFFREGTLLKTFTNPAPGQKLSFTDTPGSEGYYTYSAKATNSSGAGRSTTKRAYIGINYPAPVKNLTAMQTANPGEVKVSWTPPTTDTDGNPMNPDLITYIVGSKKPNQNLRIWGRDITGDSYTFRFCDADAEQDFQYFIVIPCTSKGNNDYDITVSAPTPVGRPYEIPFAETFGGESQKFFVSTSNSLSEWSLASDIADQDGNDSYLFYAAFVGHTGEINTGIVGLDSDNPVFSFWYLCQADGEDIFEIFANVDGTGFIKVDEVSISEGQNRQWTNRQTPLMQYKGRDVQIRVRYTCRSYRPAIDNFEITDICSVDMAVKNLTCPKMIRPGSEAEFSVEVKNVGATNPGRFKVELLRDGNVVSSADVAGFDFNQTKTVELSDLINTVGGNTYEYRARIVCPGDEDDENDVSKAVSVATVKYSYPTPTELTATVNGSAVELTWKAPKFDEDYITVTEGAEDYPAFSIGREGSAVREDYVGEWTMTDVDGLYTNIMSYGDGYLDYPNLGKTMSFMVFNHKKANCPDFLNDFFGAHSGEQSFSCIGAMNGGTNNDWMISPLLSGHAQTIKLFAKSPIVSYGRETFEVLYSTTDTNTDSFVLTENGTQNPPALWTEYSFELPAGAKYFAIRCTSEDKYVLLVDDITFEAVNPHKSLSHLGYNVYCDGELINEYVITPNSHRHDGHDGEHHVYHVTSVYAEGESGASNAAEVGTTGIDGTMENAGLSVRSEAGHILISNPAGANVFVYDTLGRLIASGSAFSMSVEASAGVYIVKSDNTAVKTIVK